MSNLNYNVYVNWDGKTWDQFVGSIDEEKFQEGEVYMENDNYSLICVDKENSDDYEPDKCAYYFRAIYK